ncbi:MAG: hypothetical protein ACOCXT_06310 [Candidatus Dojkabacteria bacterium]
MSRINFGEHAIDRTGSGENTIIHQLTYPESLIQPRNDTQNCVLYSFAQVANTLNPDSTFEIANQRQQLELRDAQRRNSPPCIDGSNGYVDLIQFYNYLSEVPNPDHLEIDSANEEQEYMIQLDEGALLIINISGHAQVVTGYRRKSGQVVFTIHDPYTQQNTTWSSTYEDISRRGNFGIVVQRSNPERIRLGKPMGRQRIKLGRT